MAKHTTAQKKQTLLMLARSGGDRPSLYTGKEELSPQEREAKELARALANYTSPKTSSFDLDFSAQLLELRPIWFHDKTKGKIEELVKQREVAKDTKAATTATETKAQAAN